jgi:hypothetical protein
VEEFRYKNVLFDEYRRKYYRICLHSLNYENGETVNLYEDKPWSIIVLNEQFDVLNEYLFPQRKYDFQNVVITRSGLLIARKDSPSGKIIYEVFDNL